MRRMMIIGLLPAKRQEIDMSFGEMLFATAWLVAFGGFAVALLTVGTDW